MSPHLPITPAEIAAASIEAAAAGAAINHLHARNPETGRPDPRPELFQDFMGRIASECDAVMNVSTGGGLGMTREERLRAAVATSPEMASLNVGSLNFGIFPMLDKYQSWQHEWEPEFLEMIALISTLLGMFNLLPLPALDGGRLTFLAFEGITRRRTNPRVEEMVHGYGMLALLALMVLVTVGDVRRLFL